MLLGCLLGVSCRRSLLLRLLLGLLPGSLLLGRGLYSLLYGRTLRSRGQVGGLLLKLSYRNGGSPFYVACAASEQTPPR